jgi:Fe-S-cluster containining protein
MSDEERSESPLESREELAQKILKDYPRLGPDDRFRFACHPGISCFNKCCGDVNIFLSPYDVLRMKRRLGMTSEDFLDEHTILPVQKDMKTPVVVLKMKDDEAKSCPFLTEEGCGIYSDRPWPCRMYPLGQAAQKDTPDGWRGERFYFLMQEEVCQGFGESREWTVQEWLDDQGIDEYDFWGEGFKELALHQFFEDGGTLTPEKMHMLFTACYDLDKFREFVFESTLLERFEVDPDFVLEMRNDDEALLRFAFLWIRFSLFGEPTMKVRSEVAEAFKGKLEEKELFGKESAGKAPTGGPSGEAAR